MWPFRVLQQAGLCGQDLRDAAAAPPARGGAARDALAPATTRGHQRLRGPLSRPVDDSSGVRWRPAASARIARRLSRVPSPDRQRLDRRIHQVFARRRHQSGMPSGSRPAGHADGRSTRRAGRRRLALGTSHGARGGRGGRRRAGGCDPWPCKGCARLGADRAAESGLHPGAGARIASAAQDVRQGGAAPQTWPCKVCGGKGAGTAARDLRASIDGGTPRPGPAAVDAEAPAPRGSARTVAADARYRRPRADVPTCRQTRVPAYQAPASRRHQLVSKRVARVGRQRAPANALSAPRRDCTPLNDTGPGSVCSRGRQVVPHANDAALACDRCRLRGD